jgi:hypothetical protein
VPRTPASEFGKLFNFAGGGLIHVELFALIIMSSLNPTLFEAISAYLMAFGTHANRPSVSDVPLNALYFETDTGNCYQNQSSTWTLVAINTGGGGGATLAQGTLAGRGSSSGSGVYEEITVGSGLSLSGTTLAATASSFSPRWTPQLAIAQGASAGGPSWASSGGDFTNGWTILATRNLTLTSVAVGVIAGLAGKNVKVTVWDRGTSIGGSASSVDSKTINSVSTGRNVATFTAPLSLTSGHYYTIGQYITDGSSYMHLNNVASIGAYQQSLSSLDWDGVRYCLNNYSSGDNAPTSASSYTSELYGLDLNYS